MSKLCLLVLTFATCIVGLYSHGLVGEGCNWKRATRAGCLRLESYRPWEGNEICKKYDVKISDKSLQPIALASYYSSGNTYLRHLVEKASGIMTGIMTPPNANTDARSQVQCGLEFGDGKTLLVSNYDNMYDFYPDWFRKYLYPLGNRNGKGRGRIDWPTLSANMFNYRGVVLVRNPWLAIIETRRKFQYNLRGCTTCPKVTRSLKEISDFEGQEFQSFVSVAARHWIEFLRTWISNSPHGSNLVIIKYEDLVANPEQPLRAVLQYLNVTIDEDRLSCALNDGQYYDSPSTVRHLGMVEEAFKAGQVNQVLERGIDEINQLLAAKGIDVVLDYMAPNWRAMTRSEIFSRTGTQRD